MADPYNFKPDPEIFEQSCTVKDDKSYRKYIVLVFQKKIGELPGEIDHLGPKLTQKWQINITLDRSEDFI